MPRFFIPDENIKGDFAEICGGDAKHITQSLRMNEGDIVSVCDFSGREYKCSIVSHTQNKIKAKIISVKESNNEPPYRAVLYQSLAKGERFDIIVQKAVECGITKIVPVLTERCISRPDKQTFEKKLERWKKIAKEASMQCGRAIIPDIEELKNYDSALDDMKGCGHAFICYEGDETIPLGSFIKQLKDSEEYKTISFMIGPEGGFSADEIKRAKEFSIQCVGLGKRILRCETAAPFVLACLTYEFELI